jgi:hypothetical protein
MYVSPTCVVSEKGATEATLNVSLVAREAVTIG